MPPDAEAASAAALAKERDKAARDARAAALREQAASQAAITRAAEQEAARRRFEESRARPLPPPPPVHAAAPVPAAPARARTAQETCAGSNPIARGICEARECVRREHTDEALCQRLRAADDRRRQQD